MFRTTAAYISGGICGPIWQPGCGTCGKLFREDLRSPFNRIDQASFRDVLDLLLSENGGDFRHAQFTADTVIRIERRAVDGPGKYRIHVKEIELANLPDCADFVNVESYTGDFMGDDD